MRAKMAKVSLPLITPSFQKRNHSRNRISEETEQQSVIAWARLYQGTYSDLAMLCHYPSGGSRHILEAVKLKRMGVLSGVPDLILFSARGGYFGAFVELKALDGKVSPAQKKVLAMLEDRGYFVRVCYGAAAAIAVLTEYLKMSRT